MVSENMDDYGKSALKRDLKSYQMDKIIEIELLKPFWHLDQLYRSMCFKD